MDKNFCKYCGQSANFISVNNKIPRCVYRITQCPGFIKKAEESRQNKISHEDRIKHMKLMSVKGNNKLKELHKDLNWTNIKSNKIKEKIKSRGGLAGPNNPKYGKPHSDETKNKMKESASCRDNSKIGKYTRTEFHKEILSKSIVSSIKTGKLKKLKNTKPEILMKNIFEELKISYEHQYLIQFKNKNQKMFRHLYDFRIKNTNILIEVDGDYWHSLPHIQHRDLICNIIAEDKGYQLFRFSENLLINDYNRVKDEISFMVEKLTLPR